MRMVTTIAVYMLTLAAGTGARQAPATAPPDSSAFSGYWLGTLSVRARELRLLIHVTPGAQPGMQPGATFTSIDQNGQKFPAQVRITGRTIELDVNTPPLRVRGTLRADNQSIDATFEQAGATFPIVFARVDGPPKLNRPQEPVPPFPYDAEEVTIDGPVRLAGTLTKPKGIGPWPAVLLISGSGPQDRDQNVFSHKTFLVLSDYLTRRGIAVLRVDDRGAGASAGERASATIDDYAADALAGVKFLAARSDIDRARIGLIGHSEGGVVAPIVAGRTTHVRFMVLLAAPAMDGAALALLQAERIARAAGAADDQIELQQNLNRRLFAIMSKPLDEQQARAEIRAALREELGKVGLTDETTLAAVEKQIEPEIRRGLSPWFRHFLNYDPLPAVRASRVPTLALFGALDVQVPAKENAPLMADALKSSSSLSETTTLTGLNHLFQTAKTGALDEYGRIDETFAPLALETISSWIARVVSSREDR